MLLMIPSCRWQLSAKTSCFLINIVETRRVTSTLYVLHSPTRTSRYTELLQAFFLLIVWTAWSHFL